MRYSRQELLVGKAGQEKLSKSSVAVVGLGALGSVSAELLARSGVGKLVLIDRDVVEISNLQRQFLYDEKSVGMPKANASFERLKRINSDIRIDYFAKDINFENISMLKKMDLVLDCTDNLMTRFLLNDFAVKNSAPFVYSSGVGAKGYVFNIVPGETACLRCFLKDAKNLESCETSGVFNSLTAIVASIQSNEALKILLNWNFEKKLLFVDIIKNEITKIKVGKNKNCDCCFKRNFEFLEGKKEIVKMCGNYVFQVNQKYIGRKEYKCLKDKLGKIGSVRDFGNCINFENKLTVFSDGRALIKAKSEKEAKSLYSRFIGN